MVHWWPVDSPHGWPVMREAFPCDDAIIINTLRPRQNGRHFADDIFKCIFLNQNVWIPIKISLKFVPKGPINNIPSLVQIMVWHRPGAKPLSEPMMVSLLTHNCVTRPQWVNLHVSCSHMAQAEIILDAAMFSRRLRIIFSDHYISIICSCLLKRR